MGTDQRDIDAAGNQGFECGVGRWVGKAVEPPVLQVGDARRELKAEQGEERKDVLGIAAAVSVVTTDRDIAVVVQQTVKDMQGFARRCRDHLGMERRIAIGEVGVELASGNVAVMGIDAASIAGEAAGPEELAVRG